MRLLEIHMHAKYKASISTRSKVMANVKVADKQTNKTGQKQYALPPIRSGGGIKIYDKNY